MGVEEACSYVEMVGKRKYENSAGEPDGLPNPAGLYISGAEPLSQIDDLQELLDQAKNYGMPVEIVTSTLLVDTEARANAIIERFHDKIHLLTIRTSRADLDRDGIVVLQWMLHAARNFDLSFQIVVGVGAGNEFPRELFSLEEVNSDTSVFRIDLIASGAEIGPRNLAEDDADWPQDFLMAKPPRYARCAELMGFVIVPGGDVYPCASGVGFPELCLGNLRTQSVDEIVQGAVRAPLINQLRNEGPFFLYSSWQDPKPNGTLHAGFVSSCDFHRQVLASRSEKPMGA